MQLPRGSEAVVPRRKITEYLLNPNHPVGASKAAYFVAHGFRRDRPEGLGSLLRQIARTGTVVEREATNWGMKYVVEGVGRGPDGRSLDLRVVWILGVEGVPRLVTAYPTRGD